jgi:hypothetical protein
MIHRIVFDAIVLSRCAAWTIAENRYVTCSSRSENRICARLESPETAGHIDRDAVGLFSNKFFEGFKMRTPRLPSVHHGATVWEIRFGCEVVVFVVDPEYLLDFADESPEPGSEAHASDLQST